jgi:hypothetical protein
MHSYKKKVLKEFSLEREREKGGGGLYELMNNSDWSSEYYYS